jgi:N4-gp56 family major capsid protein
MPTVNELVYNSASDLNYWRPYLWSAKVYEEAKARMFWMRFMGPEGSGMPIILKSELLTQPGQLINISQIANLSAAGVTGESTLRGNEEKLTLRQVQCSPEWYRHAVADTRKAEKQINQDFRMKAQGALSYWMAAKMDTSVWTAARLTSAVGFEAGAVEIIYGNDAAALNHLDAADDFGVEEIRQGAAILEANNVPRVSVPGMPAGEGYYLCFIHPYQAYSLKKDSEWIANHQNASPRGNDNPLFTGALGEIDGVILHSTTQCSLVNNVASPVIATARAIMVGQEALCRGMNEDVTWSEQIDDYEFQHGIGISAAWQDKVLSSKAIVHIVTAAVKPS